MKYFLFSQGERGARRRGVEPPVDKTDAGTEELCRVARLSGD